MKSFRFKSKVNVVEMRVGTRGPAGIQGPPGTGLKILGTVASEAELPTDAAVGDGYLIDGELFVWQANEEWLNVGQIQGPPGDDGTDGADGREIELQTTATHVQWRYVGDTAWTNLIAISEITGPAGQDGTDGANGADGTEVELQATSTHIQWRYVGAATWTNLVALSEITGPAGADGINGMSAYEIAVSNGYTGGNEAAWLASLEGSDGETGATGATGADGLSAYQIAVNNGFIGMESEWLASLEGTDGADGTDGTDGNNGWSPILAVVSDGDRRVLQIADWTGGEGTKPATGSYLGATGLVTDIADAVDIRGATGGDGGGGGGSHDPVTLAGSFDYITISGQVITLHGIDLATDITGTLPIANGGTGQTTQTAAFDALAPTTTKGDIIVHNGTDNVRVAVGADGHSLVADSTQASGVKWAAGGGGSSGAMVLLASATASNSADITFDNEFDSALYCEYVLKFQGVQPASDNVAVRVQLRNSTPADITDFHRNNGVFGQINASASPANLANLGGTTGWTYLIDAGNAANELSSGTFNIQPISGQWTHMFFQAYIGIQASNARYSAQGAGSCEGTTAPAGVKIYMSSGNISIGTFQLYGILK